MEITIYEYNGKPIEKADRIKAQELLTESMDKLEEELGKCTPNTALEFQRRLLEMVDKPIAEMPISKVYKFNTPEALPVIVDELGGSVTLVVEEGHLVGYIASTEDECPQIEEPSDG